jgi:tRNA/tmRNA/rRNA uracil-C5-methylase (TrmA/RlmC/RlmD family)
LLPLLYRQALDSAGAFLNPGPGDLVVDLYCGLGASLRSWQDRAQCCVGVELSAEAVACARINAPRALILRGKCGERIPQLRSQAAGRPQRRRLLFVNPPRTGLESQVLDWACRDYRPARLAYLSCSAGTLHRDLGALDAAGYRIRRLLPFDFFPNTHHVETLALLEARNAEPA